MRKKLLKSMKLLLVMALLGVGVNEVWGVTNTTTITGLVGAVDNTSGFNTKGNKQMSLAAGDEYVITFVNYNKGASGTDYWENWAFASNVLYCRADHGASNPYWGSATNVSYTGNSWSDIYSSNTQWLQAYNGVTVTLTVSRDDAGTGLTVSHTATTNAVDAIASQTYAGTFTATVGASDAINFYLTCEDSHLNITNVVYTDASSNETTYTSVYSNDFSATGWTANGKSNGWRVNPGTTTANTFASSVIGNGAGEGDMGLVSPTMSIGGDISIVDVSMKFKMDACTSGKSSGIEFITSDVTVSNGYVSSGTPFFHIYASASGNGYWGTITVGGNDHTTALNKTGTYENNGLNRNTTGIVTLYVRFNFSSKFATYTLYDSSGSTLVAATNVEFANSSATTLDRIFIHAGKTYGGVTIDDVEVCSVVSDVVETTYRATFTETNSLDPTVTIYSDAGMTSEVTNGTLEDGKTYYYKAVLYGYNDVTGNFTVSGANPSIPITMTAKEQYNYSLKYKLGTADAEEQASGTKYVDETVTIYYPVCRKDASENYYVVSKNNAEPNFGVVISSTNKDVTVNYTLDESIIYYAESEDMAGSRYGVLQAASRTSNGASYCSTNSENSYIATNWTVAANGNYDIEVGMANRNYNVSPAPQLKSDAAAEPTATLGAISLSSNSYTIKEYKNQPITAGDQLYFYNDNSEFASKWALDYVILRNIPNSSSVTVSAAGYATYVSPYALDFSETGIKAYKAKVNTKGKATLTKVDEVPAGTPVLLYKDGGATEDIPVIASAAAVTDNDLVAGTGAAVATNQTISEVDYTNMILNNVDNKIGFYYANGKTVAENRAYLHILTELAPDKEGDGARMTMVFADEETGINSLTPDPSPKGEGSIYTLSGQRVSKPMKGLYIIDGKKVLVNDKR